jgi:hypothetical protein
LIQAPKDSNQGCGYWEYVQREHCCLCFLEATGRPDMSDNTDQGPLRCVVGRRVVDRADPTVVLHLECGHTII